MNITDVEMAEKYADTVKCEWESDTYWVDCRDEVTEAFLEGLKAGRPKWHMVADGDLPKENKLYLVVIKDNGLAIAYFNGRRWETKYNLGDFGHCVETVIAWCEIPTFDKE